MDNPSQPNPNEALLQPQAAPSPSPNHRQSELARCSKRSPSLAGASSVAYPAWGEEGSKKPPGLRQAIPRRAPIAHEAGRQVRAARAACELCMCRCCCCCVARPNLTFCLTDPNAGSPALSPWLLRCFAPRCPLDPDRLLSCEVLAESAAAARAADAASALLCC
jgi:hypothetical protein